MKKAGIWALILVFVAAAAFGIGFFTGRNARSEPITVSALTVPTRQPAETTVPPTVPPTAPPTDAITAPVVSTEPVSETDRININTATAAELTQISGIGDVIAQRIVDYREENGDFTSLEELTNVAGIGEKRLASILEAATVGG